MGYFALCITLPLFLFAALNANEPLKNIKQNATPRIYSLLPEDCMTYPKIEPAIPENFVKAAVPKFLNNGNGILWGEKEDLISYVTQNDSMRKNPIFILIEITDVTQSGPDSFIGMEAFIEKLKRLGAHNLITKNAMWGKYPLRVFEGNFKNGAPFLCTLVGLNSSGHLLMAMIFDPDPKSIPDSFNKTKTMWDNFISNTKELDDANFPKAPGLVKKDAEILRKYGISFE
jgi:hypothetical protein